MRPLVSDIPEASSTVTGDLDRFDVLQRAWISESGETVGRVAVGRWIRTTWLAHQLTARTMHPDALVCWRDLYRFAATAPVYSDGAGAHLVAFYDLDGPWGLRFTESFTEWLEDSDLATSLHVERYQLPAKKHPPGGRTVERAQPEDLATLDRWLDARYPPLVRRALAWDADGLRDRTDPDGEGGIFAVNSTNEAAGDAADAYILVDPAFGVNEPGALAWLVPAEGGASKSLIETARCAAGACGFVDTTIVSGTKRRASTPGESSGLIVWSAEGLRQFDQYLNALEGPDGPLPWRSHL